MTTSPNPDSSLSNSNGDESGSGSYQICPRGRAIKSCLECRRRKMRCNRSQPCQNCSRFSRACVYLPYPDWPQISADSVSRQISNKSESPPLASSDAKSRKYPDSQTPLMMSGSESEPDLLILHDGLGTGLHIGRLAINEKLGGLFGPQAALKVAGALSQDTELSHKSTRSFESGIPGLQQLDDPYWTRTAIHIQQTASLEPPSGLLLKAPQCSKEWESYFPSLEQSNLLSNQYFFAVDPLAHFIHKPTLELEVHSFFFAPEFIERAHSLRALLLAIYLAAAVSLSSTQCQQQFYTTQDLLVAKLKIATEKALADANYMKSIKLQTLQAFTTYLMPQFRAEVTSLNSNLVGALVRLAQCAGLQCDAVGSNMTPEEFQVRSLLWHQICFLDLHAAETQGQQPKIRADDFNTLRPIESDDATCGYTLVSRSSTWTNATFSLMRSECNVVHRIILEKGVSIDNKTIKLATFRRLVERRKGEIEEKYLSRLDENQPIQRCAKLVGKILTGRFNVMLLYRYWKETEDTDFQREINDILIETSLTLCESAAALETDTDLQPWAWYAGAYQQYHTAVLLLMTVHRDPSMPHADRINRTLDHVFGRGPAISSVERNRDSLRLLAEQLNSMHRSRNIKTASLALYQSPGLPTNELAPACNMVDETQWMGGWQPTMSFHQEYMNTPGHTPDEIGEWWDYPHAHSTSEYPTDEGVWDGEFAVPNVIY